MKRLAIVTTHPVQYNAPWFQLLAERKQVELKVFYTWSQVQQGPKYDPDFGKVIEWDLPLLEGYSYMFVQNMSKNPGSHHFKGIDTPTLTKEIQSWRADVVLVIGWAYKGHLHCLRYFKNKLPVLFRGDSTLLDETKGAKTILRRIFLSWVYRHIDIALFAGTNNKEYFLAHGVKERQLIRAYHAIDNDRFSANEEMRSVEAQKIRQSLSINPTDFVVLFAGKLEAKKNPFYILSLAKQLKEQDIVFLLVGNGHLEESLKEAATNDKRIKFLSFQNQTIMPAIYTAASVFILPSLGPGETWGLAANEAMACGRPVILSAKTGGAIDLVSDNGLVFKPEELASVVDYLRKLKASQVFYEKAKQVSLNQIKKFSFVQIAQAIEYACGQP